MRLILGLIVCRVKIVHSTFKASIHDGEVLIRESHVDHKFGLMAAEKSHKIIHIVGIHAVGHDIGSADSLGDRVTLAFCA